MNWQPIETAPKDGTPVILRDEKEECKAAMRWVKSHKRWEGQYIGIMGPIRIMWDESYCKPTHWMPLPEPPQ